MRKVAVTGALGSGKTTVCRLLKELGAEVVSADEIVHELLTLDLIKNQVIALLGPDIVTDNKLDRHKIAQKVFQNALLLEQLESFLHPKVFADLQERFLNSSKELFVAEVPLLFETHSEGLFDKVILVVADEKVCMRRFMEKTGYDEREFQRRSKRFMAIQEKIAKADFVIDNSRSDTVQLKQQVADLFNQLRNG